MFRISALNDLSSVDDDSQKVQLTKTKEAKEAEAFAAYTKALSYQQRGNSEHAEKLLQNLFDHPLLREAADLVDSGSELQIQNHRGLQLLYSIHKNLAAILLQRDELQKAMAAYLKAVQIDSSEVTVWFKMGLVARKLHNYPLAKICFQQALQCNPNHWPSLDNAITVTFALGDYLTCLEDISLALEKDCDYPKGLALRKQILVEQPSLESMTKELFLYCDPRIHTATVDPQESKEYTDEAVQIRAKQRQLVLEEQEKELRPLAFLKPLTPFTWQNVGEQLIDLYDYATTSDPPKSLGLEVDLRDYFFLDQSVFLGCETDNDKNKGNNSKQPQAVHGRTLAPDKVKDRRLSSPSNEKNSAFQRAQEQTSALSSVPHSLNIGDNTKESALLRRIRGHGVQESDPSDHQATDKNKCPAGDKRLVMKEGENDLEEMDVSDALEMPLLREEEMNMAVMGLSDIRKLDLKPELLLKAQEDFEMTEARSLENVLSSVIDMEFGTEGDQPHGDNKINSGELVGTRCEITDYASNKMKTETATKDMPLTTQDNSYGGVITQERSSPQSKGLLTDGSQLSMEAEHKGSLAPTQPMSSTPAMLKQSLPVTPTTQSISLTQTAATDLRSSTSAVMISTTSKDASQSLSCVTTLPSNSLVVHPVSSVIETHPSQVHSPHSQAHLFPPPAHISPAVTQQPAHRPQSDTPQQAHISPPQTQQGCILPTLSSSLNKSAPVLEPVHVSPTHAPLPAHITPPQSSLIHSPVIKSSPPRAHMTPAKTPMSLSTLSVVTPSGTSSTISPSHSSSTVARKSTEQLQVQHSSSSVQSTDELIHSPIAASLLSPNSGGPCPKSASAYHSVLSSIESMESDTGSKRTNSSQLPEPPVKSRFLTSELPSREASLLSQKEDSHKSSQNLSHTYDRRSTGDLIEDVVRSQLMKEMVTDKSSVSKISQASPQSYSTTRTSQGQSGLVLPPLTHSRSLSSVKTSHAHHSSSSPSLISLSPSEMPTYLPSGYQGSGLDVYRGRSGSLSLPRHHLNTLSTLEAESLLQASSNKQLSLGDWTRDKAFTPQSSFTRKRPPSLSRSSSLPGYYTQQADLSLPTYLSPPPIPPSPVSPLFLPGRKPSQHSISHLLPLSTLHPSSASQFSPYPYPPHHQDSSNPFSYPASLYASYLPGFSPPHCHFPTTTTPATSAWHSDSFLHQLASLTAPTSSSTMKRPSNETVFKESKSPKLTSPVSSSNPNLSSHSTSQSPSHSSSQQPPPPQLPSPRHWQGPAQNSGPGTPAWTSPVFGDEMAYQVVSGDHSYQKKGILFQAMVESMLASAVTSTAARTSTIQSLPAAMTTAVGARNNKGGRTTETAKKTSSATSGSKRGPKRKLDTATSEEWACSYKRRSTRSRSTRSKKEEKSIDYQKLMMKYFPPSLLHLEPEAEMERGNVTQMDVEVNNDGGEQDAVHLPFVRNLKDTEENDVKEYVKQCLKSHGISDLIYKYLLHLARKFDHVWYEGIADIYLRLYDRLRKHLCIPTIYCGDDDTFTSDGLKDYATVILAKVELSLDQAVSKNASKTYVSPTKAKERDPNLTGCLGEFYQEDLRFLSALTGRDDAMDGSMGEFSVRIYWLKARQHRLWNETIDAVDCFEIVQELLGNLEKKKEPASGTKLVIMLPNLSHDKVISLEQAKNQLESLQRCRSLEDTQKLYDQGNYMEVVDHLISTVSQKPNLSPKSMSQRERPSQLLLLLDSLYNIQKMSECMQWAEVSLHEAVLHFKRVPTLQLHQDWATTLVSLFNTIDRIMNEDENILQALSQRNLVRMSHNLVSVIETCLDVADTVTEMPIPSVLPWKILYRVLKHEEVKSEKGKQEKMCVDGQEKESKSDNTDDEDDEEEMSQSLTMLIEAHEYLGRHSWCTRDDGLLLLFTISELQKEMEGKDEELQEENAPVLEQCFYCLYGHPNKRGRARHLSDHNAATIPLTWERAGPVFHHFAPHSIPEFDSYRTNAVSPDVENLLRRISDLVPDSLKPGLHLPVVTDFIEGVSSAAPKQPALTVSKERDPYGICSLLYYLLGDFYFKSKEPAKAVKFYLLDVVLNCDRLDSWAGLALAKMSQIEQKLNSTDLKVEKPLNKNSEAALQCFRRAVELESGSRKLWLEYGSLAYQLHSHASRQIRYREILSISTDILKMALSRRQEMLQVAKKNYSTASECEGDGSEEDWLTHYMLGKMAEKQWDKPEIFLEHYKQAALCLYEEKAVYPRKIQFVNIPPRFALEALEVFYRIHVSVLKLMLSRRADSQLDLLDKYVTESLDSPFARAEEKPQKPVELVEEERVEEAFVSPKSSGGTTPAKAKHIYHKNPIDHEYSRHKSASDSQSEGEESRGQTQDGKNSTAEGREMNMDQDKVTGSSSVKGGNSGDDDTSGRDSSAQHLELDSKIQSSSPCRHSNVEESATVEVSTSTPATESDEQTASIDEELDQAMDTQEEENVTMSVTLVGEWRPVDNTSQTGGLQLAPSSIRNTSASSSTLVFNDSAVGNTAAFPSKSGKSGSDKLDSHPVDDNAKSRTSQTVEARLDKPGPFPNTPVGKGVWESQSETDNMKDSSQTDSQTESMEDDDGGLSCGNEADVDTDAMDIDDDEDVILDDSKQMQGNTVSVNVSSSNDKTSGTMKDDGKTTSRTEMMEVHTETDHLSVKDSVPLIEVVRRESEGFTPSSATLRLHYSDSEDDDRQAWENLSDGKHDNQKVEPESAEIAGDANVTPHPPSPGKIDTLSDKTDSKKDKIDTGDEKPKMEPKDNIEMKIDPDCRKAELVEDEGILNASEKREQSNQQVEPQTQEECMSSDMPTKAESTVSPGDTVELERENAGKSAVSAKGVVDSNAETGMEKWENEDKEKSLDESMPMEETKEKPEESSEEGNKSSMASDSSGKHQTSGEQICNTSIPNQTPSKQTPSTSLISTDSSKSKEPQPTESTLDVQKKGDSAATTLATSVVAASTSSKDVQKGGDPADTAAASINANSTPSQDMQKKEASAATTTTTADAASTQCKDKPKDGDPTDKTTPTADAESKPFQGGHKEGDSAATTTASSVAASTPSKDPAILRAEIITKCMSGLALCASRFPSHYKSLYRLADLYYTTKKLDMARDLLLGRPDWQDQQHMPAPGLFHERKQTNFFQGLWKIPIEDIDRSGCFASHVHRSVKLLLLVLTELGDLEMLKYLHVQLKRTPDQGKKYLRDAERMVLAEEAYQRCVTVVEQEMNASDHWSETQREENLVRTYRVWMAKGKNDKHQERVTDALHKAFKIMMKGKTDVNRLTADQAIKYCQQNLSKDPTPSTPQAQSRTYSQSASEKSNSQSAIEKGISQSAPYKGTSQSATEKGTGESAIAKGTNQSATEKDTSQFAPEKSTSQSAPEKVTSQSAPEKVTSQSNIEKSISQSTTEKGTSELASEKITGQSTTEKSTHQSTIEKSISQSASEKSINQSASEKSINQSASEKSSGQSTLETGNNQSVPEESNNLSSTDKSNSKLSTGKVDSKSTDSQSATEISTSHSGPETEPSLSTVTSTQLGVYSPTQTQKNISAAVSTLSREEEMDISGQEQVTPSTTSPTSVNATNVPNTDKLVCVSAITTSSSAVTATTTSPASVTTTTSTLPVSVTTTSTLYVSSEIKPGTSPEGKMTCDLQKRIATVTSSLAATSSSSVTMTAPEVEDSQDVIVISDAE